MKTWEKPQLVVLTRSRPEEAVLGYCKQYMISAGPDASYLRWGCDSYSLGCPWDCSAHVTS